VNLTYVLVDFENLQPQSQELGLLRGDDFRVRIFHGPQQKKFDVEMFKALQPLGDKVELVQSDRQGPDALDFHLAFTLGRVLQEHSARDRGQARSARFFVVSKDRGFDSLLAHVRQLGYEAHRVSTVRAALKGERPEPVPAAVPPPAHAVKREPKKQETKRPETKRPETKRPEPAKHEPKKPPSAPKTAAALVKAPAKLLAPKPTAPAPVAAPAPGTDARQKVIESLRRMGDKTPSKRKGLERHIESHLAGKLTPDGVRGLIAELEREGVLTIVDNKVEYRLPKSKG
jgi:hypothetical protein